MDIRHNLHLHSPALLPDKPEFAPVELDDPSAKAGWVNVVIEKELSYLADVTMDGPKKERTAFAPPHAASPQFSDAIVPYALVTDQLGGPAYCCTQQCSK
jgi:hypothetical protein